MPDWSDCLIFANHTQPETHIFYTSIPDFPSHNVLSITLFVALSEDDMPNMGILVVTSTSPCDGTTDRSGSGFIVWSLKNGAFFNAPPKERIFTMNLLFQ